MRRPSTVESLLGAAAAIRVACALSGSVFGGTTNKTVLFRLRPNTEVVPVFVEFEVAVPHLRPAGW
jgi:hypothetical protein